MKLLPLSPAASAFVETEILGRYVDDLEARERPEIYRAAEIVLEFFLRSKGRDLAVVEGVDVMLLEVVNAIDDAIEHKRSEEEFSLNGRDARSLYRTGEALRSKVLRALRK